MSRYLVDRLAAEPGVEVFLTPRCASSWETARSGGSRSRTPDGRRHWLDARALFVFIGAEPHTAGWATDRRSTITASCSTGPDAVAAVAATGRRGTAGRLPFETSRRRRLRRRRRAERFGQAGRFGGRRRLDGRPPRARVPRGGARPVTPVRAGQPAGEELGELQLRERLVQPRAQHVLRGGPVWRATTSPSCTTQQRRDCPARRDGRRSAAPRRRRP